MCGMVLRLGSNLLLTRLLAPEAFGILGTALAFMTTWEWLSDMGVQSALIRHPNATQKEYLSTGWWITLYRDIGLTSGAAACAWPAALFYNETQLSGVLAVLALRSLIIGFRCPGVPVLRRELNYKSIFVDELSMTIRGTITSVGFALIFPFVLRFGVTVSYCFSFCWNAFMLASQWYSTQLR